MVEAEDHVDRASFLTSYPCSSAFVALAEVEHIAELRSEPKHDDGDNEERDDGDESGHTPFVRRDILVLNKSMVEVVIDAPKDEKEDNCGPVGGEKFEELTFLGFDASEDEEHRRSCLIDNKMHYLDGTEQKPGGEDIKECSALKDTQSEGIDANGCDEV